MSEILHELPHQIEIHSLEFPMTWDWLGGFSDGEGSFRVWYVDTAFHVIVELTQKEKEILEDVRDFITKELGIYAGIYYLKPYGTWRLFVSRIEDAFLLSIKLYPHLHHTKRRNDCLRLINETTRHVEMMIPIERERHRIAIVEKYERILKLGEKMPHLIF